MNVQRRKLLGGVAPAVLGVTALAGAAARPALAHPSEADRATALRGGATTGPAATSAPRLESIEAVPIASRIPDVEVWTHTGRRARFRTDLVADHVVLLNVFFTTCGDTCPLVTQNLAALRELLGDRIGRDVFMYSISLLPELETPEVLREYAALHGIGPGWELLTGAPADVGLLRRGLGFTGPSPEADLLDDQHTGMLRYGSAALDRWSASPALLPPTTLARAIQNSLPPA
jgi:protein SCO1/2